MIYVGAPRTTLGIRQPSRIVTPDPIRGPGQSGTFNVNRA